MRSLSPVSVCNLIILWLNIIHVAHASCDPSDGPCQVGSGDCTAAVHLAIAGDLIGASQAVFYGKYCGGLNKCVPEDSSSSSRSSEDDDENTCNARGDHHRKLGKSKSSKEKKDRSKGGKTRKGKSNSSKTKEEAAPCPAVPCDIIDIACFEHDACLDEQLLLDPPPPGERIPVPQRCSCDVEFLSNLATEAATATELTGLCDASFYQQPISARIPVSPIDILGHESVFIAAGFCCDITLDQDENGTPDCGEDPATNAAQFAAAELFCDSILRGLGDIGVQVC